MPATNRYRNVSDFTWTPATGTATILTGIKSATYDEGNQLLKEGADFDAFPTVGGVVYSEPKITVETLDAFALFATVAGSKGTLSFVVRDNSNGDAVGGGAKQINMANAFLGTRTQNNPFNQLSNQTISFECISTDGATHPVSFASI
jgi:hypothetical protein